MNFHQSIFKKYSKIVFLFALAFALNALAPWLLQRIAGLGGSESSIAATLWCLSLFLGFGWACSKVAEGTLLPNFTLQLLVGIVLHDALAPLAQQPGLAVVICTGFAAIILKSGGDEIERKSFLRIAYPTVLIAVLGYTISFAIFYTLLCWLGLDGNTAGLLAAICSSTDPAALIPTLKQLAFKGACRRVADIAVAESAINDAVGAIITIAVMAMLAGTARLSNLQSLALGLFSASNAWLLGQQLCFGALAGCIGWAGMWFFERYKRKHFARAAAEPIYDFAIALGLPLFTFLLAQLMHGNGYLAAFIAGLLGNFNRGSQALHALVHSMEVKIESLGKPAIFMMLGPFVALQDLADTALWGLACALVLMLVARPVSVFLSLLPSRISSAEKCFLCVVRETGVIPVVLAVMAAAQFPELKLLLPLTAWVVIYTLTILPAITPWWAGKLKILE